MYLSYRDGAGALAIQIVVQDLRNAARILAPLQQTAGFFSRKFVDSWRIGNILFYGKKPDQCKNDRMIMDDRKMPMMIQIPTSVKWISKFQRKYESKEHSCPSEALYVRFDVKKLI